MDRFEKTIKFLQERTKSLSAEELLKSKQQYNNMMDEHKKWIQTPEGLLEVLADPNVVEHPHLSPTFLWRDEELTHEEKMKLYADYRDYHSGKWE